MESLSSFFLPVLFAIVIVLFTKFVLACVRIKRLEKAVEGLMGEPKHWLWGNLDKFSGLNEEFMQRNVALAEKYPSHRKAWLGPATCNVVLYHPSVLQDILRGSEPKPSNQGAYILSKPWIGDGLLLSSGQKWVRNRRLLTPAFHFDILKSYIKIKNNASPPLLKRFENAVQRGGSLELFEAISSYTLDVMLRCAMSFKDDVQREGKLHPYLQAVRNLTELWAKRNMNPLYRNEFIYRLTSNGRQFFKLCDYVHSISERIIRERSNALDLQSMSSNGPHSDGTDEDPTYKQAKVKDFLDILLQARDDEGNGLTLNEIRDEVDTFLFEGHDTTMSGISWILYALACHPEHQKLCQEEIDAILAGRDSDDILWDDLPQLKYVTLCIKESLRLYPPVPGIQRQLTKPLTINGVTLPVGQVFSVSISVLHRHPQIWEHATEFKPERFLPENFDKIENFAYVPFSAGPRNCIGQHFAMQEMKIAIAKILRRFSVFPDPLHVARRTPFIVLKAEKGLHLIVKHREGS